MAVFFPLIISASPFLMDENFPCHDLGAGRIRMKISPNALTAHKWMWGERDEGEFS